MRHFFYPIASLLFAIAPAAALHAATINETFSFADMSNYGFADGSNVAQFNPALGTLNSVTYSFTVTSTVNPPPANNQAGYYFFELGPSNNMQNITGLPVTLNGTLTNTSVAFFGAFTGTGSLTPAIAVQPFPGSNPGNGYSSTFSLGTVTYNYTPSPTAVPETSSFGLLGAGLIALGLLRRRSRLRGCIQEL